MMGSRGIISDKWSMRILWGCALGSAVGNVSSLDLCICKAFFLSTHPYDYIVGLYMVAVERQTQNRARALAEGLRAAESQAGDA